MSKIEKSSQAKSLSTVGSTALNKLVPTSADGKTTGPTVFPLATVLDIFLKDLWAVQKTHRVVMPHVMAWLQEQNKKNYERLENFETEAGEDGKTFYKTNDVHSAAELLETMREIRSLGGIKIPDTLQRSLFTQIFCEFDSFIGALLKAISLYTSPNQA